MKTFLKAANSKFAVFMVFLQLAKQDWVRKSAEGLQIL
jgi:hypothetical protein